MMKIEDLWKSNKVDQDLYLTRDLAEALQAAEDGGRVVSWRNQELAYDYWREHSRDEVAAEVIRLRDVADARR